NLDASRGRMKQAREHFEAGLVVARELGDRQWEGNALCNLGWLNQALGALPEAREQLEAALRVAREMGHVRLEAIVLCNLGIVHDAIGDLDAAQGYLESALVVAREMGDRRSEGQFRGYLGTLHARQRRFDDARRQLDVGAQLLRDASDSFNLGVLLCGRAEMEWLSGSSDAASATLAEAAEIGRTVGVEVGSELAVALDRVGALLAETPTSA
ncbi:MAG: tetratricopeptide repeat protein, partial [Caldimonas sp.]